MILRGDPSYDCFDCELGTRNEYYMVHHPVWDAAGMPTRGRGYMLCIGCLEVRLGRRLVPADFTDAPINTDNRDYRSRRLRDRLGHLPTRTGAEVQTCTGANEEDSLELAMLGRV